jgi:two-component system cell cycle response regulator
MPLTGSRPATTELDAAKVDVLIVDDDDAFRESLWELVQQLGFVTVAAANVPEALRIATDRPPRLILLDLQMPGLSGWQFLERRRADPRLSKIPVVIVSALGAELARRGDVDGHLAKPVDEQALSAMLHRILSRAPGATAGATQSPTILVVEDDADTQASVVELLQDSGYRVARANNGQEAEAFLRNNPRPGAVVLDLWMPVMDGWTFTNRLRQLGGPAIPMVVITAAEPYWGYPVPLAYVVRKPLHSEAFLGLLRELVPPPAAAELVKRTPSRG